MSKITVDKAFSKANAHLKRGELEEAKRLIEAVLRVYPKNKRAQAALKDAKKQLDNPPHASITAIVANFQNGNFSSVIKDGQALTSTNPEAIEVWNIMGVAYAQLGMLNESLVAFETAIKINPYYADGYGNLGNILRELGKLDEAYTISQKAIDLNPEYAEAYNTLGNVQRDQHQLDEAVISYRQAINLQPNYTQAYCNLGNTLMDQKDSDQAILAFKEAEKLNPNNPELYNDMGNALKDLGDYDEAMDAYEKALAIQPNFAEVFNNIGNLLQAKGKLEDAILAHEKALSLKPKYVGALFSLGNARKSHGNFDEALVAYRNALEINPKYVKAHNNIGTVLKNQGKLNDAIAAFRNVIAIKPDYAEAHLNLCFMLLNSGRLAEGLDEYEWRWKVAKNVQKIRNFLRPLWDGQENLADSTVLVWHEQGVGDTINWSAYVSLLADRAKHCIFECPPKLVPLFTRSFPNIEVRAENRKLDAVRTDFDYHLPIGSLYRHFLSDICQRNNTEVFLRPAEDRVRFWKERLKSIGNGPYVGIGWKSSRMTLERMPNYAPIEEWAPLLKLSGVTFVNLQYSDFKSDLDQIQKDFGVSVHNFDDLDLLDDLDDVAALCLALDHVVSTTSAIPYISAGVGTSTMLASWKQSSWSSQPFYPSGPCVRKFDRNTWEPWNNVFNQITAEILKASSVSQSYDTTV